MATNGVVQSEENIENSKGTHPHTHTLTHIHTNSPPPTHTHSHPHTHTTHTLHSRFPSLIHTLPPPSLSPSLTEVFADLTIALERLRAEEYTWDEDINFLQSFVREPCTVALTEVNDGVAKSQGFEQPVGAMNDLAYEVGGEGRRDCRVEQNGSFVAPSSEEL